MLILEGHKRSIRAVAYAPGDPLTLVSAGDDRLVRCWSLATGTVRSALAGHRCGVLTLVFQPNGRLVSGDRSGCLLRWDLAEQRCAEQLRTQLGPIISLACSPDGNTILAVPRVQPRSEEPGNLVFWWTSPTQGATRHVLWPSAFQAVAFAPVGRLMALADEHRRVEIWEISGARRTQTPLQFPWPVRALAFAPRPEVGLLAVATGTMVDLIDLRTYLRRARCKGHRLEVTALAFTPDCQGLLSASADRSVRLWDVPTGRQRAGWGWELGPLTCVACAPDGLTAAAGGTKSGLIVWDVGEA
jgi:hypothetical protein